MSKLLELEITTPEGKLLEDKVSSLIAETEEGEVGILYNHAEMRAKLAHSPVRFKTENDAEDVYAVLGGVIELANNKITILTSFAERGADIDEAEAEKQAEHARAEYQTLNPNAAKQEPQLVLAEARLQRELLKLKAARLSKAL
jgi:F-type H+-transporting ATPase subunit epsilon